MPARKIVARKMRRSRQGAIKEWEKELAEEEGKGVGSIKMGKCRGGSLRKIGRGRAAKEYFTYFGIKVPIFLCQFSPETLTFVTVITSFSFVCCSFYQSYF
jgi:hypothetical protein